MQRFYNWCGNNSKRIIIWTMIICIAIIKISMRFFGNEYQCNFHWYVSWVGCAIMWFVSFCIVDKDK